MFQDELQEKFEDVSFILEQLDLTQDITLQGQMALVKIELDAAAFKLPEITPEVAAGLDLLHHEQVNSSLYKILESALGYYALIDQPKGTNEPLIGPGFAQELLGKMKNENLNLTSLKDELHILISKELISKK